METTTLEQKVELLPRETHRVISDYVDFLIHKYRVSNPRVKPYAGCMKGMVTWMSDDFNAPLDDFKDYM